MKKPNRDMSIEEILKSIRGIIDNHESKEDSSSEKVGDDVLELTNIVTREQDIDGSLLSEVTINKTSDILKHFGDQVKIAEAEQKKPKPPKTIEELVVEMIKPNLKEWLDQNLPNLVEKLVEKEMKKIVHHEK